MRFTQTQPPPFLRLLVITAQKLNQESGKFFNRAAQALARKQWTQHQILANARVKICRKLLTTSLATYRTQQPFTHAHAKLYCRQIPDDAIAWVLHCAGQKPKELGYAYELWTYSLLQGHVRKHCLEAGHPSLTELSRSRLHRILTKGEIRPHKIRYYVERRDPEFEGRGIPGDGPVFPAMAPFSRTPPIHGENEFHY